MPEVLFGLGVREEAEVRPVTVREEPATGGSVVAELNQQIAAAATVPPEPEAAPPEAVQAEIVAEPVADDPF